METKSAFDSFELQITPIAQNFLKEAAKWAYVLSIFGFIGIAFMLFSALIMIASSSAIPSDSSAGPMGMVGAMTTGVGIAYLLFAVLYFFPVMYLYKFSDKMKTAISNSNTETLTDSLENLKSHFKFLAIFIIAFFVLAILGFLIGVIAGIGAASGM